MDGDVRSKDDSVDAVDWDIEAAGFSCRMHCKTSKSRK